MCSAHCLYYVSCLSAPHIVSTMFLVHAVHTFLLANSLQIPPIGLALRIQSAPNKFPLAAHSSFHHAISLCRGNLLLSTCVQKVVAHTIKPLLCLQFLLLCRATTGPMFFSSLLCCALGCSILTQATLFPFFTQLSAVFCLHFSFDYAPLPSFLLAFSLAFFLLWTFATPSLLLLVLPLSVCCCQCASTSINSCFLSLCGPCKFLLYESCYGYVVASHVLFSLFLPPTTNVVQ